MNGRTSSLPDLLQGGWWFGLAEPEPVGPPQAAAAASVSHKPAGSGRCWWWPFGSPDSQASAAREPKRGQSATKQRISRVRSASASLDAAGRAQPKPKPRSLRAAASANRLQEVAAETVQQAAAVAEGPAVGTPGPASATAIAAPATAPAAPKRPLAPRQSQGEGHAKAGPAKLGISGSSTSSSSKQLSYQERRRLWRERLEHARAKADRRAATSAAIAAATEGSQAGLPPVAAGMAGRKFARRHIAIPASLLGPGPGGSSQSTPVGSPTRRASLLGSESAGEGAQQQQQQQAGSRPSNSSSSPPPEFLDVPLIWQGFQTAEAPVDFGACSEEQLRRFLLQAGRPPPPAAPGGSPPQLEGLASAAREARNCWEVERIMVACQAPQEVLRVPRHTDAATLKAAYRRTSMQVHPDKNKEAGASDAMSIVADAYNMLTLSGGKPSASIPAFMRQNRPARPPTPAGQGMQAATAAAAASSADAATAAAAAQGGAGGLASAACGPGYAESTQSTMSHASSFDYFDQLLQEQCSIDAAGPAAAAPPGPTRRSSSSGDEPPAGRSASRPLEGGSDWQESHWNPHGHLSSTEELLQHPVASTQGARASPAVGGGAAGGAAAASPQSPAQVGAGGGQGSEAGSSQASTPERPAASGGTPGHSRSSSSHSFSGYEGAGGATRAPAAVPVPGGSAAPIGRPAGKTKLRVTVKYKAAGGAGTKK